MHFAADLVKNLINKWSSSLFAPFRKLTFTLQALFNNNVIFMTISSASCTMRMWDHRPESLRMANVIMRRQEAWAVEKPWRRYNPKGDNERGAESIRLISSN